MIDYNTIQSKNPNVQLIMGIRGAGQHGNPIMEPWELGFECPICHTKSDFDKSGNLKHENQLLRFSEYNAFLWCPKCNIDLPTMFCYSKEALDTKEKVQEATINYLSVIENGLMRLKSLKHKSTLKKKESDLLIAELRIELEHEKNFKLSFFDSNILKMLLKERLKEEKARKKEWKARFGGK
jgi:hypothetical protein